MDTQNKSPCPHCGRLCSDVTPRTIRHHIRQAWQWEAQAGRYFYCGNPACAVVYFGDDGSVIPQTELHMPDAKQATADALVCHCFGVTVSDTQCNPTARDFVFAQTRDRQCACEVRNPSGRCCLADLAKVGAGGTAPPQ